MEIFIHFWMLTIPVKRIKSAQTYRGSTHTRKMDKSQCFKMKRCGNTTRIMFHCNFIILGLNFIKMTLYILLILPRLLDIRKPLAKLLT